MDLTYFTEWGGRSFIMSLFSIFDVIKQLLTFKNV